MTPRNITSFTMGYDTVGFNNNSGVSVEKFTLEYYIVFGIIGPEKLCNLILESKR